MKVKHDRWIFNFSTMEMFSAPTQDGTNLIFRDLFSNHKDETILMIADYMGNHYPAPAEVQEKWKEHLLNKMDQILLK